MINNKLYSAFEKDFQVKNKNMLSYRELEKEIIDRLIFEKRDLEEEKRKAEYSYYAEIISIDRILGLISQLFTFMGLLLAIFFACGSISTDTAIKLLLLTLFIWIAYAIFCCFLGYFQDKKNRKNKEIEQYNKFKVHCINMILNNPEKYGYKKSNNSGSRHES